MLNEEFIKRFTEATTSEIPDLLEILKRHYEQIPSHQRGSFSQLKDQFINQPNNFVFNNWKAQFITLIREFKFQIEMPNKGIINPVKSNTQSNTQTTNPNPMPQTPVIFTAFANPEGDLKNLNEEQKGIQRKLLAIDQQQIIRHLISTQTNLEDYFDFLQQYENQISIFHFAGHANSEVLSLQNAPTFFKPLAAELVLRNPNSLQLVFLNGCSTYAHVQTLFDLGVPAVIATLVDVADNLAMKFSVRFYDNLAKGDNIPTAYNSAANYAKGSSQENRFRFLGSIKNWKEVNQNEQEFPWGLYIREGVNLEGVSLLRERIVNSIDSPRNVTTDSPQKGHLLHSIPKKMQVGNIHRCIIRVSLDKGWLLKDLPSIVQANAVIKEDIRVSDKMEVIFDKSDYFDIKPLNSVAQLVDNFSPTDWSFDVVPKLQGSFPLNFRVSVILNNGLKELILTESVSVVSEKVDEGQLEFKVSDVQMSDGVKIEQNGIIYISLNSKNYQVNLGASDSELENFINQNKNQIGNITEYLKSKENPILDFLIEKIIKIQFQNIPQNLTPNNNQTNSNMQVVKIFLASSSELKMERDKLRIFISTENDRLIKQNIYLELVQWEYFLDAISETRLQDEYNKALMSCDIVLSLFFTKVGKFTLEEFEKALYNFKTTNKPLIYTYFKEEEININQINLDDFNSLANFKNRLKALGHFPTFYKNIEELQLKFKQQLDLLLPSLINKTNSNLSVEETINQSNSTTNSVLSSMQKKDLKELFGKKPNDFFKKMEDLLKNDNDKMNILLIKKTSLDKLKADYNNGFITKGDYNVGFANISISLYEMIDSI
jgi:hypothetical protein